MALDLLNKPEAEEDDAQEQPRFTASTPQRVYDDEFAGITGQTYAGNPRRRKIKAGGKDKSASPEDLAADEAAAGNGAATALSRAEAGLAGGDEGGYFRDEGRSKSRGGIKGFFSGRKGKRRAALAGGGGLGSILLIMVILSLFSGLKIVHLAENVAVYNLARTSRNFRQSVSQATEEQIGTEVIEESTYNKLVARFGETRVGQAIEKFNTTYRPQKVFAKLQANSQPVFEDAGPRSNKTLQDILGNKKVFKGWEVHGEFIEKTNTKWFTPFKNYREKLRFSGELNAVLEENYRGTKSLVRGSVLKKALAERGIKLKWYEKKFATFGTANAAKAEELAAKRAYDQVNRPSTDSCLDNDLCGTSKDADDAVEKSLKDSIDEGEGDSATSNQKAAEAGATTIKEGLKRSKLENIVDKTSIVYAVAVPACLVFDGSIENSEKTIDANDAALQGEYMLVQTARDQQFKGDDSVTADQVGALSGKIGNIGASTPMRRASGEQVDSAKETNGVFQPQASGTGDYSLFHVLLDRIMPNKAAADLATTIAKKGCTVLTDLRTGLALVVIENGLAVLTGGASRTAGEGAALGFKALLKETIERIATTELRAAFGQGLIAGTRLLTRNIARVGGEFVVKTGVIVAGTFGVTELAKTAVLKHMNAVNNGLATDETFADQVDMGGNLYANTTNRQLLYGRPLLCGEVQENRQSDITYLNDKTQRESFSQRYFAMTNPSSLASIATSKLYAIAGRPLQTLSSTLGLGAKILSGSIIGSAGSWLTGSKVHAASLPCTGAGDYNIVQWGWSAEETNLIDNDEDYAPMVNGMILDQSGKTKEIEDKYSDCYTASMGRILSKGWVVRNHDGSVKPDEGKCSPNDLGPHNKDYGDLVFRWRLMKRNNAVQQHLRAIQNAGATSGAPA